MAQRIPPDSPRRRAHALGLTALAVGLGALGCEARAPTTDPAETLLLPSCVAVTPAEVRFAAVGDVATLRAQPCGEAGPVTVVGLGLTGGASFAVDAPPSPWKAPSWGSEITVRFAGPAAAHDSLWLLAEGAEAPVRVALLGPDAGQGCPDPTVDGRPGRAFPLDVVALDGSSAQPGPGGAPIVTWQWAVLDRPPGSTAAVVEAVADPAWPQRGGLPDDPSTPQAALFLDLAGRYRLGLTVTDASGVQAPGPDCPAGAQYIVDAVPDAALHVQLVWHTPDDPDEADVDGSDLDLHLRRAGARWGGDGDCFYGNRAPDWPPSGAVGDPSLDIDDVDGQGPENINVDAPSAEAGHYEIGVHAFRLWVDPVGRTRPSEVTVRVYVQGTLSAAWRRTLDAQDSFWAVARAEVAPDGSLRVVPVDTVFDAPP